jgi:hypothetical protein
MKELSAMPETTVKKFRFICDTIWFDELNHASDGKFSTVIFENSAWLTGQFE